jgi:metal-responsive CopG/Arc/MetJ family transcriptional regulator
MATYKILYWQHIPSQIKVEDAQDEISVELPQKFMEHIDKVAHQKGLQNADDYLDQWKWSEEEERDGTAQEVADAVKAELIAKADW